jgi:hypothetical protein
MTDKDTEMKAPGAKAGAGPVVVHIANNTDTPVEFCPHCGGILTPQAPPEPDRCSRCGEAKPIHKVKFEDDRERILPHSATVEELEGSEDLCAECLEEECRKRFPERYIDDTLDEEVKEA